MAGRHVVTYRTAWIVLGVAALSHMCFAATVTVAPVNGTETGDTVSVPVSLRSNGGEKVAAVQLDMVFDPKALKVSKESGVAPGAAAITAKKDVNFATIGPDTIRVIVAGFNQNVIADGVFAIVTFNPSGGGVSGGRLVVLSNLLLSDPSGNEVPSNTTGANVEMTVAQSIKEGPNRFFFLLLVLVASAGAAVFVMRGIMHRGRAPAHHRGRGR